MTLLLHRRPAIAGQPGSGKTTFLRLVANVLARDFLGEAHPDAATWRSALLGADVAATVPVLLPMSELAGPSDGTAGTRGHERLLAHLAARSAPTADGEQARAAWDRLRPGPERRGLRSQRCGQCVHGKGSAPS